jgi:hypothetical protein
MGDFVIFCGKLVYFTVILSILRSFGIFFPFWYILQRKTRQPFLKDDTGANRTTFEFTTTTPALCQVGAFLNDGKFNFILQTRYSIRCIVHFYSAGVVPRSWSQSYDF